MKKKKIIIPAALALGLALAGYAVYRSQSKKMPDPKKQSQDQIVAQLQSQQFRQLDSQDRRQYARSAIGEILTRHAENYTALPVEQRTAYLDQVIDDMQGYLEQMRQQRRQRRAENPDAAPTPRNDERPSRDAQGRRGRHRDPQTRRARSENIDPKTRALISQFFQAIRARMQQRGIQPPFHPRPGR